MDEIGRMFGFLQDVFTGARCDHLSTATSGTGLGDIQDSYGGTISSTEAAWPRSSVECHGTLVISPSVARCGDIGSDSFVHKGNLRTYCERDGVTLKVSGMVPSVLTRKAPFKAGPDNERFIYGEGDRAVVAIQNSVVETLSIASFPDSYRLYLGLFALLFSATFSPYVTVDIAYKCRPCAPESI
ncbi:hypothetical protein EV421DRAFT_1500499 [Armillaria borealis]|uniref:Uncharacterized protein n=1 Tax=Armillaria borealis TaxID=47425 RepID=A0AA39IXY6_9AGAR|nr:hypothetical protein EV421DRAFT_1500499 [Armillaria borealis]